MEETKELQTMYKIFRCLIYLSLIVEFFEYAIDPALLDYWGGIVCDIHSRVKRWFIYMDGNLVWSKIATIVLICITCIGTRNKKHLEFDARRQVFYPLVSGLFVTILSIWLFGHRMDMRFTNAYNVNLRPVIKCDIKDNKVRVTYTVPFYSVNVAVGGGWMGAMGGTIPTRSDQNWPLDKCYPFAKKDSHKKTSCKALVMAHAYSNVVMDKIEECIKNGLSGNENDNW